MLSLRIKPPPKKRQCLHLVCILCALEMGGEDGLTVLSSTVNFAPEKHPPLACSQFFLLLMLTATATSRIRFDPSQVFCPSFLPQTRLLVGYLFHFPFCFFQLS
jgi:hypothetical protein